MNRVHFTNVDEALEAYSNNLPWDASEDRAWVVLAALEYILLTRPVESRLSDSGLSYDSVRSELAEVRKALGIDKFNRGHSFVPARSDGVI